MLETKEQKQLFFTTIALIVVLLVVSIWHRPQTVYVDQTNYSAAEKAYQDRMQATMAYLAALNTSPKASQMLFEEVMPQAVVEQEVVKALKADQQFTPPAVPDSEIKVAKKTGRKEIGDYMMKGGGYFQELGSAADPMLNDLFAKGTNGASVQPLVSKAQDALEKYRQLSVPSEAVQFHKGAILALQAYVDVVKNAQAYAEGSLDDPWPSVYQDYLVAHEGVMNAQSNYQHLNSKYNLTAYYQEQSDAGLAKGNIFVPAAHAQWLTIDVWEKVKQIVEVIIATALVQFELAFVNMLINKLEQTYRISNYLYYADAVMSGQYVQDYLKKYVPDNIDKQLIQNFIPQITCGMSPDMRAALKAKADQHLGYDPATLNPSDPDFYSKMGRAGDYLSRPDGWEMDYQDVAQQSIAAAKEAVNNELNAPGMKSARTLLGDILKPAQMFLESIRVSLQKALNMSDPSNSNLIPAAKIASNITQALLNQYLFQGVVIKEQSTCVIPAYSLATGLATSSLSTLTIPDKQCKAWSRSNPLSQMEVDSGVCTVAQFCGEWTAAEMQQYNIPNPCMLNTGP